MHTLLRAGNTAGLNEYVAQNRSAIEAEPMGVRWMRRYAPRLIEAWRANSAPTGTRHPRWTEAQMQQLFAIVRAGFPDRARVQAYAANPNVGNDARLETIGRMMALAGQAEYILGTMYHHGENWETPATRSDGTTNTDTNRGPLVDHYRRQGGLGEPLAWCTAFAGYLHGLMGFREDIIRHTEVFNSNNRLRGWHADGQNHGRRPGREEPDSAVDGRNDYSTYSGQMILNGAWTSLTNSLRAIYQNRSMNAEAQQTAARQALTTFFRSHPTPQAGDTLVINRREHRSHRRDPEDHTTTVEAFDASNFTISTVEGNNGEAVRGQRIELLANPDAARNTVADISSMHRLGLEFFTATRDLRGQGAPGTAATGTTSQIEAGRQQGEQMLNELQDTVNTLRRMAQESHAVGQGNTVAEMSNPHNIEAASYH